MACGRGYKTVQPRALAKLAREARALAEGRGVNPWAAEPAYDALGYLSDVRGDVRRGNCDLAKRRLRAVMHKLQAARQRAQRTGPPPPRRR